MKTKNKHGFTLIELLAVIVVLAIIALIATPIVMKTIKNAKKGAAERSADSYIKQVETAVATERINGNVLEGEYTIQSDGDICPLAGCGDNNKDKVKIEVSGNKPKSGKVTITNGQVTLTSTMDIGGCDVTYDSVNKKYVASEKGSTPAVEVLCKAVSTATTGNVPSGNFNYGDEYTCELGDNDAKTFFVLETSGDNVSLIMNANVDSNGKAIVSSDATDKGLVAWITEEDWIKAGGVVTNEMKNDGGACQYGNVCLTNKYGAKTAERYLSEWTKTWIKLESLQITLPTGQQIATAGGDEKWTESNTTMTTLPTWLYDYLNAGTNNISGVYGYWTSTSGEDIDACIMFHGGFLCGNSCPTSQLINDSNANGLRPVITISKSQLG